MAANKPTTNSALAIPRGVGPIVPTATVARLPFAYTTILANDGTNGQAFGTALNVGVTNAYNPISGTHQPYGWDQMAALYRFYKVIGFKYKITMVPYVGSQWTALGVRPVPVNENAAIATTNVGTQMERPDTRVIFGVAGAPIPSLSGTVDIPRLLGVSKEQFDADVSEYAALCTAAPSRYPYLQVAIAGTNTAASAFVAVEVEYVVHFWQRITQAQS